MGLGFSRQNCSRFCRNLPIAWGLPEDVPTPLVCLDLLMRVFSDSRACGPTGHAGSAGELTPHQGPSASEGFEPEDKEPSFLEQFRGSLVGLSSSWP